MRRAGASVLVLLLAGAACRTVRDPRPPLVQPGAPGQPGRVLAPRAAADLSAIQPTAADVLFMQGMISHHAQALEMAALVPDRTTSEAIRQLAERIALSQADEIRMMQEWLRRHGAAVPDVHAHHAPGAPRMPGMLTDAEMAQLAAARGDVFDRLFLQFMIKHHEGALVMVEELFAQPGAGQDAEIFAFASDVDADQRMEIVRMAALLRERLK